MWRRCLIRYWPIVIFPVLACNVTNWFPNALPLGWGDTGFELSFLHPLYLLSALRSSWGTNGITGWPASQHLALVPTTALFALFHLMGIPLFARQLILFWLIEVLAMISTFLLISRIGAKGRNAELIAWIASVFYVFSPIVMINFWYIGNLSIVTVMALPIFLLATDFILQVKVLYGAIIAGTALLICSDAFENPAYMIPVIASAMVFACYRLIDRANRGSVSLAGRSAVKGVIAAGIGIILNAWWVMPLIAGTGNIYRSALNAENSAIVLKQDSGFTSLNTLFKFIPYNIATPFWAYKSPGWRFSYSTIPFSVIGVAMVILIILAITRRPWYKGTGFLLGLATVGLFLSLGINSLFGPIFRWLFYHIPLFQAFRSPTNINVVLYAFGASGLIATGLVAVADTSSLKRHRGFRHVIITLIIIAIAGVYAYPMWTGSVVDSPVTIRKGAPISSAIEVPKSYNSAADFLSRRKGAFRVLVLPLSENGYVTFRWAHGYDGPDSMSLLLEHDTISHLASSLPGSELLKEAANATSLTPLVTIAGRMGCRFIVVENDVRMGAIGSPMAPLVSTSRIKAMLASLGLKIVFRSGSVSIYRIPGKLVAPMVYVVKDSRTVKHMANISASNRTVNGLGFPGGMLVPPDRGIVRSDIVKYSSTQWAIRVTSRSAKFVVILNQSFAAGWEGSVRLNALIRGGTENKTRQLALRNHFESNGFANGWYVSIPHYMVNRQLVIRLDYGPEETVRLGEEISCYAALIVALMLLVQASVYSRRWVQLRRAR